MLLSFEGISEPVALIDSEDLVPPLAAVLRGWEFGEASAMGAPAPVATVRGTSEGYVIDSRWRKSPVRHRDRIDAVCTLIVDLIRAFVGDDPSLLCLHGAAAEFAGRLVVFPTTYRSGKSTLSAYLAAAGVRVYSDDVLPIKADGDLGVAPGILPRLRLPLPKNAGAEIRRFVKQRRGPGNRRYLYLDLAAEELAPRGIEAPIGGFVILDRDAEASPGLAPVSDSEVLKRAVLQNFARDVDAADVLRRLNSLVAQARCFALKYSHGEQAVALLKEAFGHWPETAGQEPMLEAPAPSVAVGALPRDAKGPLFRRSPSVTETAIDHEMFLVNPDSQGIYHLNAVGAALWRLLSKPIGIEDAVDLLHEAFPEVSRTVIERDVSALMKDLTAKGLIAGAS